MWAKRIGKLAFLLVVAAVVARVVELLRGDPAPQFGNHPSVTGGPDAPADDVPPAHPSPEPVRELEAPEPVLELDAPEPVIELDAPEPVIELDAPAPVPALVTGSTWCEPLDGSCPAGYPVKAKLRSGIYHQPGGLAYDRTNPDRCYASAEDAEADGLRPAKR